MSRKEQMQEILSNNNIDAMLLYSTENRYWYSRFPSSLGYLLITKEKTYLFLDGRYITAARTLVDLQNVDELIEFGSGDKSLWKQFNEKLQKHNVKSLGYESDWLVVNHVEQLKKQIMANLIAINLETIRMIKDDWEIANIKKACDITNEVFKEVLLWIKPGIDEKELARFVSDSFLKHGAQKLSFDTIVASGENGAKPHAVPTDKKIVAGELITLDMGCFYKGYASDQTRTFAILNVNNQKLLEIYDIVYQAQQKGIDAIKPGIAGKEIHQICVDYIAKQGYGEYFTHGTGHGLGLQIHEEPYNNSVDTKLLQTGMVVTVEPGIYIPGIGGVRIEDDILVTKTGHEFLTTAIRTLQIVK
ncbi:Xaa-Pro peptidase family protein [Spiroplasma endosymbiont of Labia minor]|uniref:M24 family metallopeptidase n=1 Tax=Spiroplasma endosymbiont of Labia minor TaxID=3066305 RepID=UPI0030D41E12